MREQYREARKMAGLTGDEDATATLLAIEAESEWIKDVEIVEQKVGYHANA